MLYLLERFSESLDACVKTLELNPHHFGALSGSAMCALKMMDEATAERFFSRALLVNPRLQAASQYAAVLRARAQARQREPGEN